MSNLVVPRGRRPFSGLAGAVQDERLVAAAEYYNVGQATLALIRVASVLPR